MEICVAMPSKNILLLIMFAIVLNYIDASPAKMDTGKCTFAKYEETHELKSIERIRRLIGKKYTSHDDKNGYIYTVGICADLEQGGTGAAAIQVKKNKEKEGETPVDGPRIIGSLGDVHLMAGTDWAFLEYHGGENFGSHCGHEPRRTSILLACDENVGDDDARMVYVEEDNQKESDCYYLFELKHQALCPVASTTSPLSIGSILVIIFISVAAIYLLVGFAYQRFVLGSKGIEQFPNHEFWKDFGNLQADGCDLLCRTKERRNTGFRGLGDEQLDPTEEARDDNLLPM